MSEIKPSEIKKSMLSVDDIATLMPTRPQRSNKSTFGRVVAVCGCHGMSGAAYLAGLAAYRVGCGLVEIVTPEDNRIILQTLLPEAILTCYSAEAPDNSRIAAAVSHADAVIVGCGLGTGAASREVLETVLAALRSPAVIDADALNILAANRNLWAIVPEDVIITPHPGEMSRLTGISIPKILSAPVDIASALAHHHNIVCVLKDHNSIITDGQSYYINGFGNSGMATAGSGDVLAGIIGGLLAQRKNTVMNVSDAQHIAASSNCYETHTSLSTATLGVLLHSLSGDAAARELSEYSVMATDIIKALPGILKQYTGIIPAW